MCVGARLHGKCSREAEEAGQMRPTSQPPTCQKQTNMFLEFSNYQTYSGLSRTKLEYFHDHVVYLCGFFSTKTAVQTTGVGVLAFPWRVSYFQNPQTTQREVSGLTCCRQVRFQVKIQQPGISEANQRQDIWYHKLHAAGFQQLEKRHRCWLYLY